MGLRELWPPSVDEDITSLKALVSQTISHVVVVFDYVIEAVC